jgi:acyl-coenzyme A thioesterase PaaI-like protein
MADGAEPVAPMTKPWSGGGRDELASAVRRLVALTVTATAPPEALADAARRAEALADELEDHVPAPGEGPTTRFAEHSVGADEIDTLASAMPFDVIIGSCNPLALPVVIEFEPPKAIGRAVFTAPYEGAPGCVHGAAIAGAFDIMLTAANVIAEGAGPTVELSLRFLKPTLVAEPALFESWVTSLDGRRTHSRGHLVQRGVVTVEAVGEFVNMERSSISAMHRRNDGRASGNTDAGNGIP